MITTREIATNNRLMAPLLYQLHLLELVQKGPEAGGITEDQARATVADSSLNAVIAEARSRGAHVDDPRETRDSHPPLRPHGVSSHLAAYH